MSDLQEIGAQLAQDHRNDGGCLGVLARALIEAHEKIATRDAMAKSQAECIERLRKVVKRADYLIADFSEYGEFKPYTIDTYKEHRAALEPGDMGEPT